MPSPPSADERARRREQRAERALHLLLLAASLLWLLGTPPQAPAWTPDHPAPPGLVIDLEQAPRSHLELLPGVGPARARAIDAARRAEGFPDWKSVTRVRGIGPATISRWRAQGLVRLGSRAPPTQASDEGDDRDPR